MGPLKEPVKCITTLLYSQEAQAGHDAPQLHLGILSILKMLLLEKKKKKKMLLFLLQNPRNSTNMDPRAAFPTLTKSKTHV